MEWSGCTSCWRLSVPQPNGTLTSRGTVRGACSCGMPSTGRPIAWCKHSPFSALVVRRVSAFSGNAVMQHFLDLATSRNIAQGTFPASIDDVRRFWPAIADDLPANTPNA